MKRGRGVNDCFNALITTKMGASDCHQLERRVRLTTPFFSKREQERQREGKERQEKKRASVCN